MTTSLAMLSIVGTTTGAGMLLPQVFRLRRRGTLDGVSAKWVGVGLAMNSWWLAYALATGLRDLIPLAAISILLYADLARSIVRLSGRGSTIKMAKGGLLLAWVPAVFMPAAGWAGAGLAIGLCYGIQFMPAAFEAWRADRLDGLSPATWVLALIEAVAWFTYGFLAEDTALVVGGGGGSVMAAIILLRFARPASAKPRLVAVSPEPRTQAAPHQGQPARSHR